MYLFFIFIFFTLIWLVLKARNMQIWIFPYLKQRLFKKKAGCSNTKHIYFCLADHYEPYYASATQDVARQRVTHWIEQYTKVSKMHVDSDGRSPQHTYFYPIEEYDEWIIEQLKGISNAGLGDVEIHLHHDNDTAENLEKTLIDFKKLLYNKHKLLRVNEQGDIVYGFIHGNWALDNSRPDGRWCGVDNELDILIQTGCEYDMTMPSAPSDTQTTIINSIYLAKDDGKCKSHNTGKILKTGFWKENDELLMIQGPLTLNWKSRKFGIIPRIESSELSFDNPPSLMRTKLWENCGISVEGAENHIFIKLHTHGLQDSTPEMFFDNGGFEELWGSLGNQFKREGYNLHYVTAWEMYEKIKSLSLGKAD